MIDVALLQELYVEKEMSIRQIARQIGRGKETVRQSLIHAGIERRTSSEAQLRDKNHTWKPIGYRYVHKGYVLIKHPDHPRSNNKGFVSEHILVAEQKLGRPLNEGEQVHHIDRDRMNNSPDNIMVFSSHAEHMKWHRDHDGDWLFKKGQTPHNKRG